MNTNSTPTVGELLLSVAKLTDLIGIQKETINKLESRVQDLETTIASVPTMSREEVLLDRYTESSKHNRLINAKPEVIAFAAHLLFVKQVPAMRIAESGLLSQSKMHGLSSWKRQHLLDFCELNSVKDIYMDGLGETEAKKFMPHYGLYQAYLEKTRSNA